MTLFSPFLVASLAVASLTIALAVIYQGRDDAGVDDIFAVSTAATPESATTGLALAESTLQRTPLDTGEGYPDSQEIATPTPEPTPLTAGEALLARLSALRLEEAREALLADERLSGAAGAYCPALGRYFTENYAPSLANWADALVHDAAGDGISARMSAAGFEGWSKELLAWTPNAVAPEVVAEGLWASSRHKRAILDERALVAGAATCNIEGHAFYVVIVGSEEATATANPSRPLPTPDRPALPVPHFGPASTFSRYCHDPEALPGPYYGCARRGDSIHNPRKGPDRKVRWTPRRPRIFQLHVRNFRLGTAVTSDRHKFVPLRQGVRKTSRQSRRTRLPAAPSPTVPSSTRLAVTIVFDLDGNVRRIAPECQEILGYPAAWMTGRNILTLVHPGDAARESPRFFLRPDPPSSIQRRQIRLRHGDGTWHDFDCAAVELNLEGEPPGVLASAMDLATLETAAKAPHFHAHLLDTVSEAVVATDPAGVVTYWNQGAEKLYGWRARDVVGRSIASPIADVVGSDRAAGVIGELQEGQSWFGTATIVRRDGTPFTARIASSPLFDPDGAFAGAVAVSSDISELRRAEEELRLSEQRYRELFDFAQDLVFTLDLDGNLTSVNQAVAKVLGYEPKDLIGVHVGGAISREDIERATELTTEKAVEGHAVTYEVEVRASDGRLVPLEVSSRVVFHNHAPVAVMGIGRDISERKRAEQERLARESRFRALVQNSSDIVSVIRLDGRVEYVSPAATNILGYKPEELIEEPLLSRVHPQDLRAVKQALEAVSKSDGASHRVEFRYCHADGSWRYLGGVISNLRHEPSVGGIVMNAHDITEQKAFEEELRLRAFYEPLTGLPNRALFTDRLEQALSSARRTHDRVGVLFLDLDRFKLLNDTHGHGVGDQLLTAVAERLKAALRPDDTVARF